MKLSHINPTTHWTPSSTEVRSSATIKTSDVSYTLIVRCNKSIPDHLMGWLDKIIDNKKKLDDGRFVELFNNDNKESVLKVEDVIDSVVTGVKKQATEQNLKYVYMFSTTLSHQNTYRKITKKIADKLEWKVYEDRNYFIVYQPNLKIHQVD